MTVATSPSKGHSLSQLWEQSVQTASASKPHTQEQQQELPLCALPLLKVWLLCISEPNTQTHWSHSGLCTFFLSGITSPLPRQPPCILWLESLFTLFQWKSSTWAPSQSSASRGRDLRVYGGICQYVPPFNCNLHHFHRKKKKRVKGQIQHIYFLSRYSGKSPTARRFRTEHCWWQESARMVPGP